ESFFFVFLTVALTLYIHPDKSGGFDLSLKDLSLIRDLKKIESCGICSLKIEGRMKRPEYVAAAVTAVKKAVNGEYSENDEFVLKSVFSRSGFTNGYFYNKLGKNMFGTRKKEDVTAAAGVLKEISHLYDNENPLLPMKMKFICKKGLPAELYVNALGKNASVLGEIPEKALSRPLTAESLSARLSKLGGTQFYASEIKTELDDGLIIPAAKINSMRREAVEKISSIEKSLL
ncbi:MAG: U32 family peptidase, partial [Clostridiales bacterium]|nr:U32 family peptidase [Clostridiales bacterium]